MYYDPNMYSFQYINAPIYNSGYFPNEIDNGSRFYPYNYMSGNERIPLRDYGPNPLVVNINDASKKNQTFRTALWTGKNFQITLMSINVGEDIGLEVHPHVDQFLRIEQGHGIVRMGKTKDNLNFERNVRDDFAIVVPAGTWHNVINTGNIPLKLYSIYAPPNHPFGTVHPTKQDAMAEEHSNRHPNQFLQG